MCVVTGANSGIGKAAAAESARPSRTDTVDLLIVDLAVQQEVHHLGETIRADYDRLDVLVNNAGAFCDTREETVDGIERTFAVNHLTPFLLTRLVLPRLRETAGRAGEARL